MSQNELTSLSYCQVYLLVHTCNVRQKGRPRENIEKTQNSFEESEVKESLREPQVGLDEGRSPDILLGGQSVQKECGAKVDANEDELMEDANENELMEDANENKLLEDANENELMEDTNENELMEDGGIESTDVEENNVNCETSNKDGVDVSEKSDPGVLWDVFRRQDVPKVTEYLRIHWKEFRKPDGVLNDLVSFYLILLKKTSNF